MSIFYQLLEIGKKYSRFWQHYKSYIKSFPILRYSKKPMEQKIEAHKTTEKKFFASHRTTVYANTLTNTSILHIVAILYFI